MKNLYFLLCLISFQSFSQCETTYNTAHCSAEFPGGVNELRKWVQQNTLFFPEQGKEQASANFTIDTLGKALFIKILDNPLDSLFSKEHLALKSKEINRLLKSMPAWKPAEFGKPCSYKVCEIHTFYFYFYSKEELAKMEKK